LSATATGYEFTRPLALQHGYIVRINDKPHKIINL
jgi:hypothetical protein